MSWSRFAPALFRRQILWIFLTLTRAGCWNFGSWLNSNASADCLECCPLSIRVHACSFFYSGTPHSRTAGWGTASARLSSAWSPNWFVVTTHFRVFRFQSTELAVTAECSPLIPLFRFPVLLFDLWLIQRIEVVSIVLTSNGSGCPILWTAAPSVLWPFRNTLPISPLMVRPPLSS